jgi:hypothetical protein
MSAPTRRCANPNCNGGNKLPEDISDYRSDAKLCRKAKCRKWWQRFLDRAKAETKKPAKSPDGRFTLLPRKSRKVQRPRRPEKLPDGPPASSRELTPLERKWLDKVAPKYLPAYDFAEPGSPDMQPACRAGRGPLEIDHAPGPDDRDIYRLDLDHPFEPYVVDGIDESASDDEEWGLAA